MPTYGYAHVSTINQDLSLQPRRSKAAGCDAPRLSAAPPRGAETRLVQRNVASLSYQVRGPGPCEYGAGIAPS
jgi:hypothetical protein